jgi:hypothetical protein
LSGHFRTSYGLSTVKKVIRPIHKHTLNLYEGDYEILQQSFPKLGAAAVIRDIIRKFIEKNELEVVASPTFPTIEEALS